MLGLARAFKAAIKNIEDEQLLKNIPEKKEVRALIDTEEDLKNIQEQRKTRKRYKLQLDGLQSKRHKSNPLEDLGFQLSRLPEHLLCLIFSFLHPLHLYRSRLVCQRWNNLIRNEVDLKAVWAKQEPWLIVRCSSKELQVYYEVWCPKSGVRFKFPASLIPPDMDWFSMNQVATYQGLTLSQSFDGLFVWDPLSGSSKLIPYPTRRPGEERRFCSDFWADVEQGVYKVGHHAATGVHIYDSKLGSWAFEETGCEIRKVGKLVSRPNSKADSKNPFPPPASYVKQYGCNGRQDLGEWKEWPMSGPFQVERLAYVFRDGQGRCIAMRFAGNELPYCIWFWRLEDGPTWVELGKTVVYDKVELCGWKEKPSFQLGCSGSCIVIAVGGFGRPYPFRVLLFNVDTLTWDVLHSDEDDDQVSVQIVMAVFQPNLLSHRALCQC